MRVSEHYSLGRTQGELDFVDVQIDGDTALFVDPAALRRVHGQWAHDCVALVQDFFQSVIAAVAANHQDEALRQLRGLREPNETRLGLSTGRPRGRALGPDSSEDIYEALSRSEATHSGLLEHLEDTALLVRGIGPDIISDITTNLVRDPLIAYTERTATQAGIPLEEGVASGPLWDPSSASWSEGRYVRLPIAGGRPIVLVPKAVVRRHIEYDADEYLHNFILPVLAERELSANSELVRTIKYNNSKKVAKKDLIEKYGSKKEDITRVTLEEDGVPLAQYRTFKEGLPSDPPDHVDLVEPTGSPLPDYDALANELSGIATGITAADDYHRAVEKILEALFSPNLTMPIREFKIHQGRKRVDIAFANAGGGFFGWLALHYPAGTIYVECKNYSGDPGNPELDQLAGRFGPTRGQFGFLCCRTFDDKGLFVQRCRDTALDHHAFIIALDDDDLVALLDMRRRQARTELYQFLQARFAEIT
jgi:hypothetical protein